VNAPLYSVMSRSTTSVAVVGNPNCGKSTVFNGLTGGAQDIGNWPGVTVEKKSGRLLGCDSVEIVDLPGIYSLNATSEDEIIARNYMLSDSTDLVVNIADATNLEGNLFLTLTLMEMRIPVILVLTMMDVAAKWGTRIDIDKLSKELGIPVYGINALDNVELRNIRRAIRKHLENPCEPEAKVKYPRIINDVAERWAGKFDGNVSFTTLLLLEEDEHIREKVVRGGFLSEEEIQSTVAEIETVAGKTPDILIAETRYTFITALARVCSKTDGARVTISEAIDRIVLSRWLGVPIFLGIVYLLFWSVIQFGGAFINFFDILFGAVFVEGLALVLQRMGSPEWLQVLLANGVGGGIQTVATFIPIIFMMFFMLSLLEDSGYMARASYVMDRFMRVIGLPGKAFVPMLVGFGCSVPAILATRTLENKKDRYLTIFMSPFMSCSARLPVYALFGVAFFGRQAGIVVVSLYVVGILLAVATGFLLKKTLFKGEVSHFAMELPPYHTPRLAQIMKRTWFRLKDFVFRAGQIIVLAVLILSFLNSMGVDGSFGNEDGENSILAGISRGLTPVFSPMGVSRDNWPATVGLFTGIFAKEAIVGTMSSLYRQMVAAGNSELSSENDASFSLLASMKEAVSSIPASFSGIFGGIDDPEAATGILKSLKNSFDNDWVRAYAYLLFVLIYFPCVAAMGTIIKEIGAKFGVLAVTYLTILAWSVATLFYQIVRGHNILFIILPVILVMMFIALFNLVSGRIRFTHKASP